MYKIPCKQERDLYGLFLFPVSQNLAIYIIFICELLNSHEYLCKYYGSVFTFFTYSYSSSSSSSSSYLLMVFFCICVSMLFASVRVRTMDLWTVFSFLFYFLLFKRNIQYTLDNWDPG